MADPLLRVVAAEWDEALANLDVAWGPTVVVVGADVDILAESLLLADTPPLVASTGRVAILGDVPDGVTIADATPTAVPLPDSSAHVVIAVHAWPGPGGVPAVVREATRLVRRNGSIVLAEIDLPRLAASTPRQYPSALMRIAYPAATAALRARSTLHSHLEIELVRSGATSIAPERFDVTRGVFADRPAHAEAVASGLWRGSVECTPAQLDQLGELVLALGGRGPVIDREPWVLVRGVA